MIYLASSSPRRAELLQQIGIEFELLSIDVDEAELVAETPSNYVCRVARAKARAGGNVASEKTIPVLAADTIITINDKIIGKPDGQQNCRCILSQLSGKTHQVLTCIALYHLGNISHQLSTNQVQFRPLDDFEIRNYCASDEPMDKAGAYAIQGKAAIFVESLEGSYSSVMGLPLFETAKILQQAGITVL
ncbi:MAG: septum formation protein [Gammaproteobacteria bacterium]|jgi:septum formation protein